MLIPFGRYGDRRKAHWADGVESSIRVAAVRESFETVFCHLKTSYLGIGQRWKNLDAFCTIFAFDA
jgi:hypothetical protein